MLRLTDGLWTKLVQQIMYYVDNERSLGHIPQPMFIVGSSGSGKSSLLRLLCSEIENKGSIERLQFLDGKQFFNSRDIIDAIELAKNDNSNNDSRQIVIIDDIDFYFKRSSFDDQYLLRNYLNHELAPLVIGAISAVDKSLADYRAPFFEGVRLVYIPPIDGLELKKMDIPTETQNRLSALLKYLPMVVRSVKIASDIVALSDSPENDLKELLNLAGPIYRSRLESLPVYSQRILFALANSKDALTLSDLRQFTNLSSGILSTYLRQMVNSKDIKKTNNDKRGVPYEICDKLFKLWLSSQSL